VLFHGFALKVLVTAQAPAAGIDTPADLRRRAGRGSR
jgi:CMP-2-keto-3-deoxyoctulosonic acid synthetase